MNNEKILTVLSTYLERIGKGNQIPELPIRLKMCINNTQALQLVRVLAAN